MATCEIRYSTTFPCGYSAPEPEPATCEEAGVFCHDAVLRSRFEVILISPRSGAGCAPGSGTGDETAIAR
jgi:hypothetical protein